MESLVIVGIKLTISNALCIISKGGIFFRLINCAIFGTRECCISDPQKILIILVTILQNHKKEAHFVSKLYVLPFTNDTFYRIYFRSVIEDNAGWPQNYNVDQIASVSRGGSLPRPPMMP